MKRLFAHGMNIIWTAALLVASALVATPEQALATGALGIDSPFDAATPDWTTIAGDGISFACIKATAQDEGFENGSFASLIAGAQSAVA